MIAVRLAVIGCGSLGLLLAAYTATSIETVLVCRDPEQVEVINAGGVQVYRRGGVEHSRPRAVHVSSVQRGGFDAVLLAVKAYDLSEALEVARMALKREGLALALALGPRVWDHVRNALGAERAILVAPYLGALRVASNKVLFGGGSRVVLVGEGAAAENVADALSGAELDVKLTSDASWAWDYTLVRASTDPLAALAGVPYGYLLRSASATKLLERVERELSAAVESAGVKLPRDLHEAVQNFLRDLSGAKPPMLVDLEAGRSTEADYILGAILELGLRAGVPMPHVQTLYLAVKTLEECGGIARG